MGGGAWPFLVGGTQAPTTGPQVTSQQRFFVPVFPTRKKISATFFPVFSRVSLTDQSGQTVRVRYRYTGPVWPETGRYRSKSNLNSKFAVQTVRAGIPVGLIGLQAGLTGNRSV